MTGPKRLPKSAHSSKRWGLAAVATAVVCLLWFAYLNRDGCWFYWHGWRGSSVFIAPWLWLTLLVGLKMKGRIVLLAVSVMGLLFLPHIDIAHVAAAESSAVGTLRQLHSALESYKTGQQLQSYPRTLPQIQSSYPLMSAYHFEYVPSVSTAGIVGGYIIEAIPVRRACGCNRSFTIADDGRMYYTLQERAATTSDQLLQ